MPAPSSGGITNRSNPYGDYLQPVGPSSGDLATDIERSRQYGQMVRERRLQALRRQQEEDRRMMYAEQRYRQSRQPQQVTNYYVPGQNSTTRSRQSGSSYNGYGEAVYGDNSGNYSSKTYYYGR